MSILRTVSRVFDTVYGASLEAVEDGARAYEEGLRPAIVEATGVLQTTCLSGCLVEEDPDDEEVTLRDYAWAADSVEQGRLSNYGAIPVTTQQTTPVNEGGAESSDSSPTVTRSNSIALGAGGEGETKSHASRSADKPIDFCKKLSDERKVRPIPRRPQQGYKNNSYQSGFSRHS